MLRPEDHFPPADRFARKKASDIEQRNIIAGAGLTEGGDLSSDVTLNVGAGEGIVVNPDDVAIDIPAETARVEALIAAANLQPADSDLTAIAALTTTAFGRALLTLADAGALRAAAALGTAALNNTEDFQAADSDLAAIAALATTAYGRGLLTLADQAAHKAALDLTGTNSGDQTSIVGITGTLAQFNTAITDADIMPTSGGIFSGDITVPAEAYGVGWNGSNEVPTKNDLYDKIETISAGSIPDPYVPADGTMNITGAVTATGKVTSAVLQSTDARLLERADSNWVVYNNGGEIWFSAFGFGTYHFWNDALSATIFSIANTGTITCAGGGIFAGDVTVPDEAYDATAWNGSLEVPTKNAVRDKFESLSVGMPLPTVYRLGSAHSNNTVTPTTIGSTTADTDWVHTMVAGKTYYVRVFALYQTVNANTGGRMNLLGAGGLAGTVSGMMWGAIVQAAAASTLEAPIYSFANGAGAFLLTTAVNPINAPHLWGAEFVFHCTTGGTLALQWASEVAASAAQLNAGSAMIVQQLN